jgi:hypothetical protein
MLAVASCSLCYVEYFGRQKNILRTCTNKSTQNAQIVLTLSPCRFALQYLGFVPPPFFSSSCNKHCICASGIRGKIDRKERVSNIKELVRTGAYNVKKKVIQQT